MHDNPDRNVAGFAGLEKEKAMKGIKMGICTRENLSEERPTAKEFILGRMGKFMMENGKMD